MSHDLFIKRLLSKATPAQRTQLIAAFVQESASADHLALVTVLKQQALDAFYADRQQASILTQAIHDLAAETGLFAHRLRAQHSSGQLLSIVNGDYQAGLNHQNDARAWAEYLQNDIEIAKIDSSRSWCLVQLGQTDRAIQCCEDAVVTFEQYEEWDLIARTKSNVAHIYAEEHQYERALAAFEDSLQIMMAQEASPNVITGSEINKAWMLLELGRFSEAKPILERCIEYCEAQAQFSNLAIAQHNLGGLNFLTGNYVQALQNLSDASANYVQYQGAYTSSCALDQAECLSLMHQFDAALTVAIQVLETPNITDKTLLRAIIAQARALFGLSKYAPALALLEQHRAQFTADTPFWYMQAQLLEVNAYLELGQTQVAQQQAQQLLALCQTNNWERWRYRVEIAIIDCFLAEQALDAAEDRLLALEGASARSHRPEIQFLLQKRLADVAVQRNDVPRALAWLETCINGLETIQTNVMPEHREAYLRSRNAIYANAVALSLEIGKPLQGFFYAERAKSRSLLALLATQETLKVDSLNEDDDELVAQYNTQRAQWAIGNNRLQKSLHDNFNMTDAEVDIQINALNAVEKELKQTWHDLLIRDSAYSDSAARLTNSAPKDPRATLAPDASLIEYYTIDNTIIAFVFTATSIDVVQLDSNLKDIAQLMQRYELNIQSVAHAPEMRDYLLPNMYGVSQLLYAKLLAPVLACLPETIQQLIIVRHNILHYIPLHTLYDGADYLLARYQVSYLPMADSLRYLSRPASKTEKVVIAGHTQNGLLPEVQVEMDALAMLWDAPKTLYEDACKALRLQVLCEDASVIHIASHGVFRRDDPIFSGVAVADGWLTALDIFSWQLSASLVTLSACETGRANIGGGDEMLGMMRAFLGAGAASLVLSQWVVDDQATQQLMTLFYQNLQAGLTKSAALQQAQLDIAAIPEFRHPWYWGAFTLIGDSGPL